MHREHLKAFLCALCDSAVSFFDLQNRRRNEANEHSVCSAAFLPGKLLGDGLRKSAEGAFLKKTPIDKNSGRALDTGFQPVPVILFDPLLNFRIRGFQRKRVLFKPQRGGDFGYFFRAQPPLLGKEPIVEFPEFSVAVGGKGGGGSRSGQ